MTGKETEVMGEGAVKVLCPCSPDTSLPCWRCKCHNRWELMTNGDNTVSCRYGFLSENVKFAERCKEEGIVFIGPKPETIQVNIPKPFSYRFVSAYKVGPHPCNSHESTKKAQNA